MAPNGSFTQGTTTNCTASYSNAGSDQTTAFNGQTQWLTISSNRFPPQEPPATAPALVMPAPPLPRLTGASAKEIPPAARAPIRLEGWGWA